MVKRIRLFGIASVIALVPVFAQAKGFLVPGTSPLLHDPKIQADCRGAISLVTDAGFEGIKTTTHNFSSPTGGGESKRFDKEPVLETKVELREGCLNAHFSAIVGSPDTYGPGIATTTLFQVTLTPTDFSAPPQHMYGHFETPYSLYGPAVAITSESDVDEIGANFFQRIGDQPGDVRPGSYYVDVWWAGDPISGGGAIGAAFVLKLSQ